MLDKNNTLQRLASQEFVALELGCGPNKRIKNAIGIDAIDYAGVDIVGDALEVLRSFPRESVDAIYSFHFFEHLSDLSDMLDEVARVLKPGCLMEVVVPHFSNPHYYSDPTHRSFFGLYTFSYFAQSSPFSRKVPTYQKNVYFDVVRVDLRFKSFRPFYFRHSIKRLVGSLFNSCNYLKELYEENFCYLFPCAEVRYQLRRTARSKI